MSTDKSQRQSPQGKPESNKQGNSTQAPRKHSLDNYTPRPFDDDDIEGSGGLTQTTPSQNPGGTHDDF
ncbi:MAG: hypothetical protein JXB05_09190 [Myxococcaceae bacterium]|nr:hypothetical protein [Myxococcaceae bacterium]